ncbi:hypothetical protein ACUSIJ_17840 [Pseudochelatococcus sp. B33]
MSNTNDTAPETISHWGEELAPAENMRTDSELIEEIRGHVRDAFKLTLRLGRHTGSQDLKTFAADLLATLAPVGFALLLARGLAEPEQVSKH